MLISHRATIEERKAFCDWKYDGEYALYNLMSYEEMEQKQFCFCNPKMITEAFYDEDKLVGFCNLYDDGDEVFFGIGVNPDSCGKGYGKEMTEKMYLISKELFPGKPLYLEVRAWNKRAINCYKKAGFMIDGDIIREETYAGSGEFYRMIKK